MLYSTDGLCPCVLDADGCLQSDVMTNPRLQALGRAEQELAKS